MASLDRRWWAKPLAFALAFAAAVAVVLAAGSKPFYYDASVYRGLSDAFTAGGGFSLERFADPLRGYAFPLILWLLRQPGAWVDAQEWVLVAVANAFVLALMTTLILPALARIIWPDRHFGFLFALGLSGLMLIFWHGYLSFPLTDLPALAAAATALVLIGRKTSPWSYLGAGFFGALSANFRPAFVLILVALLVLGGLGVRGIGRRRAVLALAALVVGMAVVSIPQSLSAHRHHSTWSFVPGTPADLSGFQLTTGLELQRYETYVGTDYPSPGLRYMDRSTEEIRANLEGGEVDGYGEYLGLIVEHPVTMAGVLARRVVNGMDQRYPTPYIEDLEENRIFRAFGWTLLFLALLRLVLPRARRSMGTTRWSYVAALAVTCATTPPSAMETRFLVPLYAFAYMVVLVPGWRDVAEGWRAAQRPLVRFGQPAAVAVAFGVFGLVMWLVTKGATTQLTPPPA